MSEETVLQDTALTETDAAVEEGVNEAVQEEAEAKEPEKITLTKEELQEKLNAEAKKARERAERKKDREMNRRLAEIEEQLKPSQQETELKLADYATEQEFRQAVREEAIQKAKAELQADQEMERVNNLLERAAKIDGYDDAIVRTLTFTRAMDEAILDSDKDAEILAYLSQNPDEADEIAAMTPRQTHRAILKIEESLDKPKKTTNAPPVGTKLTGGGTVSTAYKTNPDSLDDAAWEKERRQEKQKLYAARR